MIALTPSERRGALVFVLLLALGAGWDLWRAYRAERLAAASPTAGTAREAAPDSFLDGAAPPPAHPEPLPGPTVDLNRATAEDLDALPGIGPVLASRILAHRREHGPFERVEDLLAVRGVGPKLLERLRPRVRVEPATHP